MAGRKPKSESRPERNKEGITRITVAGFKSISQEQSIEIRPLTILAGANSSGKSSMMQPLLLLKQTLEATYDPGALLLNGPNVRFTSTDQLLSRKNQVKNVDSFHVGIEVGTKAQVTTYFTRAKNRGKGFDVEQTRYNSGTRKYSLYRSMSQHEIETIANSALNIGENYEPYLIALTRERCFLTLTVTGSYISADTGEFQNGRLLTYMPGETPVKSCIRQMIHLPGLRGNPARTYPLTAVGSDFPGTFENYVASVIGQWQVDDHVKLAKVNRDLARLGLTGRVVAKAIDDTQVELRIKRLLRNGRDDDEDMVSIADVGLGVSQTLPVLVALHAANPGQLVYLEQPEIHLHPRAQTAMAEVLAYAALQGGRLVIETHSNLLLRGVQTLVAEGKLPPELVKLHWFTLNEDGSTRIDSADLDETGAFGDWPEDFHSVTLQSEGRYIDAAEARLMGE
jgi:predicted ATPase